MEHDEVGECDGKFIDGKWIDLRKTRLTQSVEIKQSMNPFTTQIKLNGQLLKCKEYSVSQSVRSFGEIVLKLPIDEVGIVSDSSKLIIDWRGMKFVRVE